MRLVVFLVILSMPLFCTAKEFLPVEIASHEYNFGDREKGLEMIYKILESDPENIEALWLSDYEELRFASDLDTDFGIYALNTQTPRVLELIELAHKKGEDAMAYYISARLADFYEASERALHDIEKAIELEPTNIRYRRSKIWILLDLAKKEKDKQYVELALEEFNSAMSLLDSEQTLFTNKSELSFRVAIDYPNFMEDYNEFRIKHYHDALNFGLLSERSTAYAWNNMSSDYRNLGQCQKAKEAAEKALSYFDFGNARNNLFSSEACLEINNFEEFEQK